MSTVDLSALPTEQVNPACAHIDEMGTLEALRAINHQGTALAFRFFEGFRIFSHAACVPAPISSGRVVRRARQGKGKIVRQAY